jgi:S-DNA-T family DNA segregation ATPase FtsK/SpoIIIE
MLFAGPSGVLQRAHGAFVSDQEVEAVADYLRQQGRPDYLHCVVEAPVENGAGEPAAKGGGEDLFDQAVAIVLRDQKPSISYLQRRLSIGYNRAADLIERMEDEGIVGPADRSGRREILAPQGGVASAA